MATWHMYARLLGFACSALLAGCSSPIDRPSEASKESVMSGESRTLEQLRRWKLAWLFWESGGIVMTPSLNWEQAVREYTQLIGREPAGEDDSAWQIEQDQINERIALRVKRFFAKGELSPGTYTIANQFRELAHEGKIQQNSNDPERSIQIPDSETIDFVFTSEHLALIRAMNVRTRTLPAVVEVMDVKRPYGEMTYFYADMAAALGEPVPLDASGTVVEFAPERIVRYETLHGEMLFAVRVFLDHAIAPAGI